MQFDLEPGGCDSLSAIANHTRLQRNVRTVRLRLRRGLRDFPSFTEWCSATAYEHIPWASKDSGEHVHPRSQSMAQEEWDALSDNARRRFYEEYESDER